jgi:N-acetylglucosamine-6-phosphate deacetylase
MEVKMIKNGFVDLQINGYKGICFHTADLAIEQVYQATHELVKAGTIAFCPTIVTEDLKVYEHCLKLFAGAMRDKKLAGHILGLHLEGPFISPQEGARGAHAPKYIREPSIELIKRFQDWAEGNIVLLTLAPETKGAIPLIEYCRKNGIKVSMGHHFADDAIMARAVKAGASACTHLGNGLPNMINRHQNPLWWQLACDDIYGMFITEGHHLPDDLIKVAIRAKTAAKSIVVSDAVHLAGLPPGIYEFVGAKVALAPSGRISYADTPYLAGSSANMLQCMNHLAALNLLTEKELWQVCRDNPLKLLGKNPALLNKVPGPKVEFKNNKFGVKR